MLLGEELGRGHEGGLRAGSRRDPRGERGDDGLARTDVALEQARHRDAPRQIPADLLQGPALRVREREGQLPDPPRKLHVGNGERQR